MSKGELYDPEKHPQVTYTCPNCGKQVKSYTKTWNCDSCGYWSFEDVEEYRARLAKKGVK